jgi:hypothetical protein
LTSSNDRPASSGKRPASGAPAQRGGSRSPSGSARSGRRETQRRRHDEPTTLQRLRTPLLALGVIAVIVGASAFVLSSAAAPTYACTSIDTVQAPVEGEVGQVQPDQGNAHIQVGDKVTYPVCPPASGKHVNRSGFGPLQPKVYGPDDTSAPTGWVHNLEHGALVLLYSCDKGACDDASIQQLGVIAQGFPDSPVCGLQPGIVGPVIARFEEMPTKYAALVWDRVLYLETLDNQQVYDFYTAYGERVSGGSWITPPEPQCAAPSPSLAPSASPSPDSSTSPSAGPSPSAGASPSAEPSPSPS